MTHVPHTAQWAIIIFHPLDDMKHWNMIKYLIIIFHAIACHSGANAELYIDCATWYQSQGPFEPSQIPCTILHISMFHSIWGRKCAGIWWSLIVRCEVHAINSNVQHDQIEIQENLIEMWIYQIAMWIVQINVWFVSIQFENPEWCYI